MTCNEILELIPSAVMAAFLAYIAYQQMVINKQRLKYELYSKRFSVYTDAVRFHQELAEEEVNQETHRNFIASKEAARFLFSKDPSIFELLQLMHTESFKTIGFKRHAKETSEAGFVKGFTTSQEVFFWFDRQLAELNEKMKPYLDL